MPNVTENPQRRENTQTNGSLQEDFFLKYLCIKERFIEFIEVEGSSDSDKELLFQIILDRIIFIYFLQSKGIVKAHFLSSLYHSMADEENYYKDYLVPLFFEIFTKQKAVRSSSFDEKFSHVPYLHHNLFVRMEGVETTNDHIVGIHISNDPWEEVFQLFNDYEWGIEGEESSAITPSILGYIYERSVAQKQTGSYYTPNDLTTFISRTLIERYIVDSLNKKYNTNYTHVDQIFNISLSSKRIDFVTTLYFDILKAITVCDPAIGSGAFLIASTSVLFDLYYRCFTILHPQPFFKTEYEHILNHDSIGYFFKKVIITRNLYGVDINEACIEITKLRLWLSLISEITNTSTIHSLPNIDFNLLVGNSLIGYVQMPDIDIHAFYDLFPSQSEFMDVTTPHKTKNDTKTDFLSILSETKKKYKYASSETTRALKDHISHNLHILRRKFHQLYLEDHEFVTHDFITLSSTNNKDKGSISVYPRSSSRALSSTNNKDKEQTYLAKLREINDSCTITFFKINLKDSNRFNYNRIKTIDGIRGYRDRQTSILKSIYPTRSFDYYTFNQSPLLTDLLHEIIPDWDYVDSIEVERTMLLEELTSTRPFHWFLEFYDVFTERGGFDIVIGNPPYGNILSANEKSIIQKAYDNPFLNEIASIFTDRTIDIQATNGNFGYIITYAITFHKKFSGSRNLLSQNFAECYISSYDRDKCNFFLKMRQSVSIIFCYDKNKNHSCSFFTSQMYRETPQDLSNITYTLANNFLLSDSGITSNFELPHRLPKIGDIKPILLKVLSHKDTLATILRGNGNYIWYRTSGNYWYNAFFKEPYKSSEINKLYVLSDFQYFVLCLINSQLFYVWLRVYGDGRHLNKDILENMPIPSLTVLRENKEVFKKLSGQLMDRLFAVFDTERNRFSTSEIKRSLDVVDVIIGNLYGLSIPDINYVLNYERPIHGGCLLSNNEIETIYSNKSLTFEEHIYREK